MSYVDFKTLSKGQLKTLSDKLEQDAWSIEEKIQFCKDPERSNRLMKVATLLWNKITIVEKLRLKMK